MTLRVTSEPLGSIDASYVAVGCFEGELDPPPTLEGLAQLWRNLLTAKDLGTGLGETTPVLGLPEGPARGPLLAFGLGPRNRYGPGPAFAAGTAVARKLSTKPRDRVAVVLPEASEDATTALIEGLIVGQRGPDLRKSEPCRHPFGELLLVAPRTASGLEELARRAEIMAEEVNLARELANTPPGEKTPSSLAGRIVDLAEAVGVTGEVWDRDRLTRERFGGLLGVSAGSDEPPCLVVLEYLGSAGAGPPVALVGKGVTFDSGGLSLKPSASMEDMKADMTGAAVVLAAIRAAARLRLPVALRGYLPMAENMTGGRALKLGDVLTMRNGKTVEVLNTDAEGRLILADALSLAVEAQPDCVVDLATLTGACMVALGTKVAGLFSPDDELAAALVAAGTRSGERAWRLPLDDDYADGLKSAVADMKNVGGKWGGAVTAAKFLQKFVGSTRWAHLDIAGPSWNDSDAATRDAGGTGCFARTLVAWLEDRAR